LATFNNNEYDFIHYYDLYNQKIWQMKKLNLITSTILLLVLLYACSNSKEARANKRTIDGTWVLTSVTPEGINGKIKAQILDEADYNCFENSTWKFNQNTSLGSYEISKNGGQCVSKKQNFRWSIFEEKAVPIRLQYKRVDAKYYKDIDEGKAGFRFTIIALDKTAMQLKSEITFEGKQAYFIYNFTKN
jgi:Lipocalin-like domain